MENRTEIMQHVLKMQQISLFYNYIKLIFRVFLNVITYANTDHSECKFWYSADNYGHLIPVPES